MDMEKDNSDNSEVEEDLSDFEMSGEEDIDDDYFKQYVDVGVGDVLDEVVSSSQLMSVVPYESDQTSMVEVREEDILSMLSDYDSEEIEEVEAMSDDGNEIVVQRKNERYNPSEMCKDFQFKMGMEFTSIAEFKSAVREYALLNGYELKFVKNDKVRCRVKCAHKECEWLVFVSKGGGNDLTYGVKTLFEKHTCGVSIKGKNASYKWVSEKIKHLMKTNKNLKLVDIIASIREHYMVDVSVWKASKARKRAKAMIEGDYKEQYHKLKDYANEVRRCNPETTFAFVTDQPYIDRPPIFRRIYECIGAVKRGFLAGCRPIIGLDGCFLKGPYGGILLVAVGRDANEQYFPLAWAVVEGENRDSWTWFLINLLDDIGSMQERRWVFISDRQKGIVPTFEELLEGAEHRFCVRHLYANVKAKFGGGTVVRDLILRAAKATVKADWRERMNELKAVSNEAYDYLLAIPPTCWTKSHFCETCKCDMVTNNITEYVDKYLCLQSFVAAYSPIIEPINGENMWERGRGVPIDPPAYHKRPGRPPKNRKKGLDEDTTGTKKQTRVNTIIRCSNCDKSGHNRRSCKEPVTRLKLPIKRRPKKDNQPSSTQESITATPPEISQP